MNPPVKNLPEHPEHYQPVNCLFYDYLEADATLGKVSTIKYVDHNGVVETISGIIKDLHTQKGEEFLQLDDGQVMRLDSILEFNGITQQECC
jgi:Rho-binding antiterminator